MFAASSMKHELSNEKSDRERSDAKERADQLAFLNSLPTVASTKKESETDFLDYHIAILDSLKAVAKTDDKFSAPDIQQPIATQEYLNKKKTSAAVSDKTAKVHVKNAKGVDPEPKPAAPEPVLA